MNPFNRKPILQTKVIVPKTINTAIRRLSNYHKWFDLFMIDFIQIICIINWHNTYTFLQSKVKALKMLKQTTEVKSNQYLLLEIPFKASQFTLYIIITPLGNYISNHVSTASIGFKWGKTETYRKSNLIILKSLFK